MRQRREPLGLLRVARVGAALVTFAPMAVILGLYAAIAATR